VSVGGGGVKEEYQGEDVVQLSEVNAFNTPHKLDVLLEEEFIAPADGRRLQALLWHCPGVERGHPLGRPSCIGRLTIQECRHKLFRHSIQMEVNWDDSPSLPLSPLLTSLSGILQVCKVTGMKNEASGKH